MYDHVFRPGAIGGLQVPHRVVMGAMHLNLETLDDGGAALAAFYVERARGGAGLIVTGGVAVNPAGAGGPGYALIADERHQAALRRVVGAVHDSGGLIALQLFHAGRYALPGSPGTSGGPPLAPSPVHSRLSRATPREMTDEEIRATIADFGQGARTARELGFDAVEVMGSEGYLVNQFTAPVTNRRDDAWGGTAERRRRFPVEVLRAVRAAAGPAFPVLFRMSGADLVGGGTPPQEVAALAVALAGAGADALAVGVGWHESPVPTVQSQVPAGAWTGYAEDVKRALRAAGLGDLPVITSNRITRLSQAEAILASGDVDFVAMARPFLADPAVVAESAAGRAHSVDLCVACNEACIDRSFGSERVSCMVNPRAGYEALFPLPRTRSARPGRYAVIGAGPAGLEAARTLARLGHRVEVYEEATEPGGQFLLAARVPGKEDFGEAIRHRVRALVDLGVPLHLGHRVGPRDLSALRALDGVVLATGVRPRLPGLPGAELPHVLHYPWAFTRHSELGPRVAVIGGGGIAVDLAHLLTAGHRAAPTPREFLEAHSLTVGALPGTVQERHDRRPGGTPADRPPQVTVIRRGPRIGTGIGPSTRWVVLQELRALGVRMLTGVGYREITRDGVVVVDADGAQELVPADHVVLAAGQESERQLAAVLADAGIPFEVAGGAAGTEGLNGVRATAEGLRAAHRIATRRRSGTGEPTPGTPARNSRAVSS
ncbi:oxidoreductase [Streptomyces avermitilis]